MLLVGRSIDFFLRVTNCQFHLSLSSVSSINSKYLLLFLKSSMSCVLILPTPFKSVISPSIASWRRQFLLRICPTQLALLLRILFRSLLNSSAHTRTSSSLVIFSDHFNFSFLLHHHILKLSKYFRSNFLGVQVFELYNCNKQTGW